MTILCLDTCAYTHFKAGEPNVLAVLSMARKVLVPVTVLGELRAGFKLGSRLQKNEAELSAFLESPVVHIALIDEEVSFNYAEIFSSLRKKGTPVPTNDIWISASALKEGATVLSFDRHFEHIDSVGKIILEKDAT